MDDNIKIERVIDINDFVVDIVNRLLCELVSNKRIFTELDLSRIIKSDSSSLYFMFLNDKVVGMFTLCNYYSPTGRKFWLEDVVVDSTYRGRALGKRMVKEALKIVSTLGSSTLMLTSKPSRIAANKLYSSLGFDKKETNVYKMDFIG